MLNKFLTDVVNTTAVPLTNKQQTGDSCKTIAGFNYHAKNYAPNRNAVVFQRQLKS